MSCAPVGFCLARVCQASRALLAERPADIVRVSLERPRPTPMGCSPFCTNVHSFPQPGFQIPLAKKNGRVYCFAQIEPGSLKNLTAQLKEGAAAARQLRPQCFLAHSRLKSWVVYRSAFRSTRKRSNRFAGSEQGLLASACRDPLYRGNLAIPHHHGAIKVVYRGTNVARKQVQEVSDLWT